MIDKGIEHDEISFTITKVMFTDGTALELLKTLPQNSQQ